MSIKAESDTAKTILKFPKFEDIKVSTKTFIIATNLCLDIQKLYLSLPITGYVVIPKKRGRKKKVDHVDPNIDIECGSIITVEFGNNIRGVNLKRKKYIQPESPSYSPVVKKNTYFRNSITIVMIIDGKRINFKVSRNGKIQMTGCKNDEHAERCVKYLWHHINTHTDIYTKPENEPFTATFIPAMRNIDFPIGFNINRSNLDSYINMETEYNSLLETSFGYTGVNIKIPVKVNIMELKLKQMFNIDGNIWKEGHLLYGDYIDTLPLKEQDKKRRERYNTFLVFHSGKCIMSGTVAEWMKDTYYDFLDIIRNCYEDIEERLEV